MSANAERNMLKVTVSGSFHRHFEPIKEAVGELRALDVDVLSPSDPRVVDAIGEFLFVASDRLRSTQLVQWRHFEAIRQSDFVWLVSPDGYTGLSAAMEIGAAYMAGVPVYTTGFVRDISVADNVQRVANFAEAIGRARLARVTAARASADADVLLDPGAAIGGTIQTLENLLPHLEGRAGNRGRDAENALRAARRQIGRTFGERRRNA